MLAFLTYFSFASFLNIDSLWLVFNYCHFNSRTLTMVSGLGYFITWHQPLIKFRSNSISWKQKQKFPVSSSTLRREVHKLKASLNPAGFLPVYRIKRLASCLKLPRHIRSTHTVGRREALLENSFNNLYWLMIAIKSFSNFNMCYISRKNFM